ncbi:hybrid sensor histidine kinase/response regulator [Phenylobacterium immobile]|uniref:hybrid sensor histidine kinase/response regulator n=1 Tax=Phenylobacterium immobile TaxID=21 RepID=UPI000A5F9D41|nr:response regulator [Phenylobacterium immobile]
MADIRAQLRAAFEVEHREHLEAIRRALGEPGSADLREIFRRAHSLKGAARAVDMPVVESLAHELEERLSGFVDSGASSAEALSPAIVRLLHDGLDAIEAEVAGVSPLPGESEPAGDEDDDDGPREADRPHEYLRIESEAVLDLSRAMQQLSGDLQGRDTELSALRRLRADLRRIAPAGRAVQRRGAQRIDLDQALRTLERELSGLIQNHVRASWALERSATDLREGIEQVSFAEAESHFGDLGRMIRDLARDQGVEVDVRVEGLDTRAERRVLQALRDPVIHLLRNALSHGAESAATRRAAGKPEALHIRLSITAQAGQLIVRIRDDGPGPDIARIRAAAEARGLFGDRAPDTAPPTPEEVLSAAFEPGVSASEAVDRLSGRGMGLSVVQEAVRKLGGSVRLERRRPVGARVVLSAPLSTARHSIVLVEADGAAYGLPSHGVRRLLRLSADRVETVGGAPAVRLQEDEIEVIAPLAPLSALLGGATEIHALGGHISALLLARGDRRLALAIDHAHDVREIVVRTVDGLGLDRGLALGAAVLEDEAATIILNPDGLMDAWLRRERAQAGAGIGLVAQTSTSDAHVRTVLVVDDSFTTRTLEKSILEAQGYRVLLAVDGVDALGALRSGEAIVDLVVADIEMPKMDGFSLLQAIKADAGLAAIPVILMTSRNDPEDIRRGMDLGAEAYITKQKFDQRELLATIGRVL